MTDTRTDKEQISASDSALACLIILARYHQIAASAEQLIHQFRRGEKFLSDDLILAARSLSLKAKSGNVSIKRLSFTPLPVIAVGKDQDFFIIARENDGKVLIQRPFSQQPEILSHQELLSCWQGQVILIQSETSLLQGMSRFDFSWFIPAVIKYRRLLAEVFIVSLFIQLFALITPIFFQVVMDKVLVHQALQTLYVLIIGLAAVMIFESLLSGLRSYVFAHTTSRIDVELGSLLFANLIALPMAYFQARRTGDSVARVRELENIRNFLTGNTITLILDILFSVVFILAMFFYSGWLTLVVIISLPFYFFISLIITPVLRRRLNVSFERGAENQAFLVESISAIDTIKAMATEPQIRRCWDSQLAGYVKASFKTQSLSVIASESIGFISKMVTLFTLLLGARLVITGSLTVGQLIAFNMLAARVSQPVVRLAQLWTQFQQVGISMQRLGDILNTPTERDSATKTVLPRLSGNICFDNVVFRYTPGGPEILRGINLSVSAGSIVGVVGRSGSGKSTLARLLQRFYSPENGQVSIDGFDLALADVSSLRRQIGVVLQESQLLSRSIRENIALSDTGIPIDRIIAAAKMAGAHEFIAGFAEGYDTQVGEHGSLLSGGQRQRIAIARALINNPRILIFDEATSALDYESERIIRENMKLISKGRTVMIIAHRLSSVRHADFIITMDKGKIIEQGSHEQLMRNEQGMYRYLYQLQQGEI